MGPGRTLNMKVAEEIMGHNVIADEVFGDTERYLDKEGKSVYGALMPYSEDIVAAWLVVERMIELWHGDAKLWEDYGSGINKRAEAICKIALLTALRKEDELNDRREERSWPDTG